MKNKKKANRIVRQNEMELCLCVRCAASFYNMRERGISRVDMTQIEKELCTICGYRMGYDYYVWSRKSNVQNHSQSRIYTFASGGAHE